MALVHLNHFSRTLGMGMGIDVILPEAEQGVGVTAGGELEEEFPVLYLLHGFSDDHTIWQRRTSIERYAAAKKLAVVMPATHLGAYTNQYLGFDYFDYVAKEVPQLCRSLFRISGDREKNFIGGLSMGGYGALKIGLRLHDRFSRVIALSAGVERLKLLPAEAESLKGPEDLWALRDRIPAAEYRRLLFFILSYGSVERYRNSKTDNPFNLVPDLAAAGVRFPQFFITCGAEDRLLEGNREFRRLLKEHGIPHEYDEAPGDHTWEYWDTHIQRALDWLPLPGGKKP
jgi:S-formylglutathione hydrolase FrmB